MTLNTVELTDDAPSDGYPWTLPAVVGLLTRDGLERSGYDELEVVGLWRSFLDDPERFLCHLG